MPAFKVGSPRASDMMDPQDSHSASNHDMHEDENGFVRVHSKRARQGESQSMGIAEIDE